ncbi:MAG TPA: HAMP domain-containing sensor histidine kinase [Ilumatobacteraceae bacterium]|nr:HAMP domain-containing sensor histidine kinase [Ilumatobacteraceae bacterium]
MSATASPRRFRWATAATVAVLVAVLAIFWRYPGAELVVFHAVWVGLAVLNLRTESPRLHSWVLVGVVTALAVVTALEDVLSGDEGLEILILIVIDLIAFAALVWLAGQHRRAVAIERGAALAEHTRNDRQRAFFANASHALRTPITIARGHAEMALRDTVNPAVKLDLVVVLDELDRLTRATERILKLSVVGSRDHPRMHRVDVDALIRATIERWRPTAPRRWEATGCGGCWVFGDLEELTEALDALIDNSLQATAPGGRINLRSQLEGQTVTVSIDDDGTGIADADPAHLFDPFQQGRRQGQMPRGTGLGLAIVRAIARAHGGDAAIESTPGAGTTVRLTFPSAPAPRPRASNGPEPVTTSS